MGLVFEWEGAKAETNLRKHGVSFLEARTVFADLEGCTYFDPDHSVDENRYLTIGRSEAGRLLTVCHTDRRGRIRIISAREASPLEVRDYEEDP
jgi:uncharacterized DUF497 family protein